MNLKSIFIKSFKNIEIILAIFRTLLAQEKYKIVQKRGQKRIQDLDGILLAILYKVKTGVQWRLLPVSQFVNCSYITIYNYFDIWVKNGLLKGLWEYSLKVYRKIHPIKFYRQSIDSTKIKAIKGGSHIGANSTDRGRNGSKLHTLIDQNGIPLSVSLTGANISDSSQIQYLIENMIVRNNVYNKRRSILLADAGYDSENIRSFLLRNNYYPIIPYNKRNDKNNKRTKKLTKKEKRHYKYRIKIENSYAHLKNNRSHAFRYEVKGENFLGLTYIAFTFMIIAKL